MKKLLIISPYFAPVNAADMHRVRTSLPYYKEFGWDAEIVTIDKQFSDLGEDELLLKSIPDDVKIHRVQAFDKKWTSRFGLGSIAIRSLWFYQKKVNELIRSSSYDLIYFSTTQFPICILGAYWKKKFKVPYVIDMQDPWHSDYYQGKPKHQQPAKYWFSYRLNKYLEPIALKKADGLISVSKNYIDDLKSRYPQIKDTPAATITFGMFGQDLEIAKAGSASFAFPKNSDDINIVYAGRGGADMHKAIIPLFIALKVNLTSAPEIFSRLKFYFIGTSYAAAGKGKASIMPLAAECRVENQVVEITDRMPFYETIATLLHADALFIPGSDDAKYTASKIYPYLMVNKPLLAIFNTESPALTVLKEFGIKTAYNYQSVTTGQITEFLLNLVNHHSTKFNPSKTAMVNHSARNKTKLQCALFDKVKSRGKH